MARRPRYRPDSAPMALRRTPGGRLVASAGMLVALGVLILGARNPDTWKWVEDLPRRAGQAPRAALVQAGAAADAPKALAGEYPLLPGKTDADAAELADGEAELEVVHDRTEKDLRNEMPALERLLRWVRAQTPEQLWGRDAAEVSLQDLTANPRKWRGKLVRFRLKAMQAIDIGSALHEEPAAREKWQLTGYADRTGTQTYLLVAPALPQGFPVGGKFPAEKIDFVGYFYKLRTYPAMNDKFVTAPVLIGTFFWKPPTPAAAGGGEWPIGLIVAGLGAAALACLVWASRRGHETPAPPAPADPAALDGWLRGVEETPGDASTRPEIEPPPWGPR